MIRVGPNHAPSAPISFQSPPPSPRSRTTGKSTIMTAPAPSSERSPPQSPEAKKFVAIPAMSAGTVSQLGIRRARQSRNPAMLAIKTAHTEIACVLNSLHTFPVGALHPRSIRTCPCDSGSAVSSAIGQTVCLFRSHRSISATTLPFDCLWRSMAEARVDFYFPPAGRGRSRATLTCPS
jgi:hypothetical protein